jgi:phage-related protein (TIGR01555 family)
VQAMNTLMNNNSIQILGENDSYESHQYTFGGIADVYDRFMMDVAGAAETPVTKLFGRSPAGMNATGESDMQNYYDTIEEKQENELRPVYDKLLPIIMMSTFGAVPDDFDYDFNPVRRAPEDEMADLASKNTDSVTKAFQAGLISQKVALKELRQQSELTGMWTNIGDADIENADDEVMRPDEGMGGMPMGMGGDEPPEPAGASEKGEGEQVPKQKEEPPQGKRQEAREG